jgi:hypothetical protein
MKILLLILALFVSVNCNSQTIGRHIAKIHMESYDYKTDDGNIILEMDVRLADCMIDVRIENDERRRNKVLIFPVKSSDYYLDEFNQIIMRVDLGSLRKISNDIDQYTAYLIVYSMTGYPVFRRLITFDKKYLIANRYK